jgi:hypothetical protein
MGRWWSTWVREWNAGMRMEMGWDGQGLVDGEKEKDRGRDKEDIPNRERRKYTNT